MARPIHPAGVRKCFPATSMLVCLVLAAVLCSLCTGSAWGSAAPRPPKVRAITAFVRIERPHYEKQIQQTLAMLRQAKAAFEKGGYEVQTIRITTQPFPQYIQGMSRPEALRFFQALDELSRKESFLLSIGPALLKDGDDPAQADLLAEILSATELSGSVLVASDDGISWNNIRAAAKVVQYLENHSAQGGHNFNFAATALLEPYAPFFPGSYHTGDGHQFSIGLEGGNFVADVFAETPGNFVQARQRLARALDEHARALDAIAVQVEKDTGWTYAGLDATPAPNLDSSIGAAIETLTGTRFGSSGTLTAASIITQAVRAISVKRAGYSGLMLPILEDPRLAQRWGEAAFSLDALLAYSAVCGTGLDTVALPGDVSTQQLERIIGDVASLAFKWHKPLTARLIPIPGKKPGEKADAGSSHTTTTTLQPLP